MPSRIILTFLLLLAFLGTTECKLYTRDLRSSNLRIEKGWIYLDRMHFAPGEAKINLWTDLQTDTAFQSKDYKLNLLIIPDRLWDSEL